MTSPCGACGRPVLAGMRFCGYCGTAVAAWWTCASCSGENPPGTNFCGHCGRPAEAAAATAAASAEDVSETLRSFVAGQVAERLVETGGVLPEERRLITALFADVSGFTTLADKLDPEQLLEVIDPLISALSSIVGRYEGYVEKFAGDALLALFGAPVSHEDDAQRALHVALDMHREIERIRGELGPDAAELTLHVGVNSGHGIARVLGSEARMDYAVLGDSVILAQRLESAAPRGETYVSELTYRFAHDDFEFEPVGELTLKGKLEPVQAWKLLGVRTAQRRRAATEGAPELVGREREVAAIEEALGSLEQDRGAVVIVAGEAGVGKSRLSAEIRHRSEEAGRRWLETRCLSYGRGLAYWPYAELLRTFARIGPDDDAKAGGALLAEAVGANGDAELPLFARLLDLPLPGDAGAALEPEAFRRALHDAFASWLGRLASEAPVVLAIEDLHWADAASLALTEELVRAATDAPLALYLIVRGEGLETARAVASSAPWSRTSSRSSRSGTTRCGRCSRACSGATLRTSSLRSSSSGRAATRSSPRSSCVRSRTPMTSSRATVGGGCAPAGAPTRSRRPSRACWPPGSTCSAAGRPACSRRRRSSVAAFGSSSCGRSRRSRSTTRSPSSSRGPSSIVSTTTARPASRSTTRSCRRSRTRGCCGGSAGTSMRVSRTPPKRSTAPATTSSTCSPATATSARPRTRSSTSPARAREQSGCSPTRRRSSTSAALRSSRRTIRRSSSSSPTCTSSSATTRTRSASTATCARRRATSAPGAGSRRRSAGRVSTRRRSSWWTRRSTPRSCKGPTLRRSGSSRAGRFRSRGASIRPSTWSRPASRRSASDGTTSSATCCCSSHAPRRSRREATTRSSTPSTRSPSSRARGTSGGSRRRSESSATPTRDSTGTTRPRRRSGAA